MAIANEKLVAWSNRLAPAAPLIGTWNEVVDELIAEVRRLRAFEQAVAEWFAFEGSDVPVWITDREATLNGKSAP